jgi:hypothetical protein
MRWGFPFRIFGSLRDNIELSRRRSPFATIRKPSETIGVEGGPLSAALARVVERVQRNGEVNDSNTPRPLLTLAEFFEGNTTAGSIGANLTPVPSPAEFFELLKAIASRPEVADLRVEVSEYDEENDWPFSEQVWVITSALPQEVATWFPAEWRPDDCRRGWTEGVRFEPCPVPSGMAPVACWWD